MTLPAFRQRVQTYARLGAPLSMIRTFWRFGSKRRLVATIECERLWPKAGRFPQEWQVRAMRRTRIAAATLGYGLLVPPASTARVSLPDRYRVVRHLANGGMASVWEAHDKLLDRHVAVKVLASHLAEDPLSRRRFQREARAAAGLSSHPNVVTIYDVGEHDGGVFMVMELMRGGSIGDRLRRPDERSGERSDGERAARDKPGARWDAGGTGSSTCARA